MHRLHKSQEPDSEINTFICTDGLNKSQEPDTEMNNFVLICMYRQMA